jgi:prefoldin beta subunit
MASNEAQNTLAEAQAYQQQVQGILMQKENMSLQRSEIKKALDELDKSTETEIFKMSGPILIKAKKPDVKKELSEKEDLINIRIKSLEKTEKRAKEKLDELKEKLTREMSG